MKKTLNFRCSAPRTNSLSYKEFEYMMEWLGEGAKPLSKFLLYLTEQDDELAQQILVKLCRENGISF